jgi:hypothetical protein
MPRKERKEATAKTPSMQCNERDIADAMRWRGAAELTARDAQNCRTSGAIGQTAARLRAPIAPSSSRYRAFLIALSRLPHRAIAPSSSRFDCRARSGYAKIQRGSKPSSCLFQSFPEVSKQGDFRRHAHIRYRRNEAQDGSGASRFVHRLGHFTHRTRRARPAR